jgi:hypothetical protein
MPIKVNKAPPAKGASPNKSKDRKKSNKRADFPNEQQATLWTNGTKI